MLEAHLAATQALQAEAWHRGEHFEPERAATVFADAIEGLEGPGHGRVVEAYLGAGEAAELELTPGAAETVAGLAEAGVQLGIVCDVGITGSRHLRAFLERAGVLEHFRGWAFSDEVGHYKPSAEIFDHMLSQFELGEGAGGRRRERRAAPSSGTSATSAAPTSRAPAPTASPRSATAARTTTAPPTPRPTTSSTSCRSSCL